MADCSIKSSDLVRLQKHCNSLTNMQQQFVLLLREWLRRPRHMLIVVSGGPGTGKTYSVIETLNLIDCPQTRMAPTARIAQKINGKTIHSTFRLNWREGSVLNQLEKKFINTKLDMESCITESNVLQNEFSPPNPSPRIAVVDEVGMLPFWFTIQIIDFLIKQSREPILIIMMGDKHQLKPVHFNENLFDIPFLRDRIETHWMELTESKRFSPEYCVIVQKLCEYVDRADEDGLFAFVCQKFPIVDSIDGDILKKCNRVLTFRNSSVENYNNFYLEKMMEGDVVRLTRIKNGIKYEKPIVDVKKGCIICVTQNTYLVKNGTLARFNLYNATNDYIECTTLKEKNTFRITRNFEGYFPIVLGFATTVHKFQGETIDDPKIAINLDDSRDLNLVYTALSRVKSMEQILAIAL